MQSPPPRRGLRRRDREELLKKLEQSIAEEFRKRVLRGEAPVADVDIKKLLSRRLPLTTLHFEMQAPPRPVTKPRAGEEAFTERLERYLQEPPDFRTPGEKRRDARQAAARRESIRQEPSSMERLLAQLEAGRRRKSTQRSERKGKAPSFQGQRRGKRSGRKKQDKENLTDAFLKFKKRTSVYFRYRIAFHLLSKGSILAGAGATLMASPIPGSRFAGTYLLIKGIASIVAGAVIIGDLLGIFEWSEERPNVADSHTR